MRENASNISTFIRRIGYLDGTTLWIAVLLAGTLALFVLPRYLPSFTDAWFWFMGLAGSLLLIGSLWSRELVHACLARQSGLPILPVRLFPFAGLLPLSSPSPTPEVDLRLGLSRWLTGLGLAAVCAGAAIHLHTWGAGTRLVTLCVIGAAINGLLTLINLWPGLPLDGGHVLRSLLARRGWASATAVAAGNGSALGLALFLVSLWFMATGQWLGGIWCLSMGLTLRHAARLGYRYDIGRELLKGWSVHSVMRKNQYAVPCSATLREFVDDYVDRFQCNQFPAVQESRYVGSIHLHQALRVPNDDWEKYHVQSFLKPARATHYLAPDRPALEALELMLNHRKPCLPVVNGHQLLGVVVLEDLLVPGTIPNPEHSPVSHDLRSRAPTIQSQPSGSTDPSETRKR